MGPDVRRSVSAARAAGPLVASCGVVNPPQRQQRTQTIRSRTNSSASISRGGRKRNAMQRREASTDDVIHVKARRATRGSSVISTARTAETGARGVREGTISNSPGHTESPPLIAVADVAAPSSDENGSARRLRSRHARAKASRDVEGHCSASLLSSSSTEPPGSAAFPEAESSSTSKRQGDASDCCRGTTGSRSTAKYCHNRRTSRPAPASSRPDDTAAATARSKVSSTVGEPALLCHRGPRRAAAAAAVAKLSSTRHQQEQAEQSQQRQEEEHQANQRKSRSEEEPQDTKAQAFTSGLLAALSDGAGTASSRRTTAARTRRGYHDDAHRESASRRGATMEGVWTAIGAAYFQDPVVVQDILSSLAFENGDTSSQPPPAADITYSSSGSIGNGMISGGQSVPRWVAADSGGGLNSPNRGGGGGGGALSESFGAGCARGRGDGSGSGSGGNSAWVASAPWGKGGASIRQGQERYKASANGPDASLNVCGWETPLEADGSQSRGGNDGGGVTKGVRRAWVCSKGVPGSGDAPHGADTSATVTCVASSPASSRADDAISADEISDAREARVGKSASPEIRARGEVDKPDESGGRRSTSDSGTAVRAPSTGRVPNVAVPATASATTEDTSSAGPNLPQRPSRSCIRGEKGSISGGGGEGNGICASRESSPAPTMDALKSNVPRGSLSRSLRALRRRSGSGTVSGQHTPVLSSKTGAETRSRKAIQPRATVRGGSHETDKAGTGIRIGTNVAVVEGEGGTAAPRMVTSRGSDGEADAVAAKSSPVKGGIVAEILPGSHGKSIVTGNVHHHTSSSSTIGCEVLEGVSRTATATAGVRTRKQLQTRTMESSSLSAGIAVAARALPPPVRLVPRRNGSLPAVGVSAAPDSAPARIFTAGIEALPPRNGMEPSGPSNGRSIGTTTADRAAGGIDSCHDPRSIHQPPPVPAAVIDAPRTRDSDASVGVNHGGVVSGSKGGGDDGHSSGSASGSGIADAARAARDGVDGGRVVDEVSLRLASVSDALALLEDVAILPSLYSVSDSVQEESGRRAVMQAKNAAANQIERAWRLFCGPRLSPRYSAKRPSSSSSLSSLPSRAGGPHRRKRGEAGDSRSGRQTAGADLARPEDHDNDDSDNDDSDEGHGDDEWSPSGRAHKRRRCSGVDERRQQRRQRQQRRAQLNRCRRRSKTTAVTSAAEKTEESAASSGHEDGEDSDEIASLHLGQRPPESAAAVAVCRQSRHRRQALASADAADVAASPPPLSSRRRRLPPGSRRAVDESRDVDAVEPAEGASRGDVDGWRKGSRARNVASAAAEDTVKQAAIHPDEVRSHRATSTNVLEEGSSESTSIDLDRARSRSSRRHRGRGSAEAGGKRHSCREFTCSRRAHFGTPGWVPAHCVEHRRDWEVFLKFASCLSEGCSERPRFGVPGDTSRVYCKRHRAPGAVGLKSVGWKIPDGSLQGDALGGWVEAEEDGMGVPVDSDADADAPSDEEESDAKSMAVVEVAAACKINGSRRGAASRRATADKVLNEILDPAAAIPVGRIVRESLRDADIDPSAAEAEGYRADGASDTSRRAGRTRRSSAGARNGVGLDREDGVEVTSDSETGSDVAVTSATAARVSANARDQPVDDCESVENKRRRLSNGSGVCAGEIIAKSLGGSDKRDADCCEKGDEEPARKRVRGEAAESSQNDPVAATTIPLPAASTASTTVNAISLDNAQKGRDESDVDDVVYRPGRFVFLVPSKKCDRPILVGKIVASGSGSDTSPFNPSIPPSAPLPPTIPASSTTALLLAKAAALIGGVTRHVPASAAAASTAPPSPAPPVSPPTPPAQVSVPVAPVPPPARLPRAPFLSRTLRPSARCAFRLGDDEKRWIHVHWHTPASLRRLDYCRGPFTPDFVKKEGSKSGGWNPFVTKIRKSSVAVTCSGLLKGRCIPEKVLKGLGV